MHDWLFADVSETPFGGVPIVIETACAVPCVLVTVMVCDAVLPWVMVTAGAERE